MVKKIIRKSIYYIVGLLIFMAMLYLTQTIFLSILGINQNDIIINFNSLYITIGAYTVIYVIMDVGIYIYDMHVIKLMNNKLALLKEKINEETIYNRINNSYNTSSFVRNI